LDWKSEPFIGKIWGRQRKIDIDRFCHKDRQFPVHPSQRVRNQVLPVYMYNVILRNHQSSWRYFTRRIAALRSSKVIFRAQKCGIPWEIWGGSLLCLFCLLWS
jgi:hypothetical protein